ncbi:MAG: hypothetical protein HYX61_06580 [Gammaproteobacteria bacterium]|nr:hypothetical protein [Gammaproteobacteria bacterium]
MKELKLNEYAQVTGGEATLLGIIGFTALVAATGAITAKNVFSETIRRDPSSKDTLDAYNPYLLGALLFTPIGIYLGFTVL